MSKNKVKVSAFCLTTNAIENEFPFIESIKSFLPICDEMIIVDGCSTDGTIKAIEDIGDSKIKIISNEETRWDKEWEYSKMGQNSNIGLDACTGDIIVKFDIDFIMHEDSYDEKKHANKHFRKDCDWCVDQNKLAMHFTRRNFILSDRHFVKSKKTFAINRIALKKRNVPFRYGLDLERWHWGFEPIVPEYEENGIFFGTMIRSGESSFEPYQTIHNYDNVFASKETVKAIRYRHMLAITKQQSMKYKRTKQPVPDMDVKKLIDNPSIPWGYYKKMLVSNYRAKSQVPMTIDQHPKVIQDKIKNLGKDKGGYNGYGLLEEAGFGSNKSIYYNN